MTDEKGSVHELYKSGRQVLRIGGFGHGLPTGVFSALGITVEDVTTAPGGGCATVAPFIEPFMDPFAASVLHRLGCGALDDLDLLVFLRESPGALPAFHYACEFQRRGLLSASAPKLFLLNLVPSTAPSVQTFNATEIQRLAEQVGGARPPVRTVKPDRTAMATGPVRQALLGAPLGNTAVQSAMSAYGVIVFDQQAEDQARSAAGADIETALAAFAGNPFSARQPKDVYVAEVRNELIARGVNRVVWQVDEHDDLWGWLAPDIRKVALDLGCAFVDLGFLPRWPDGADVAARLRDQGGAQ